MRVDWPGRWQKIKLQGRCLILDSSHNPEGIAELEKNLFALAAVVGRAKEVRQLEDVGNAK